MLQRLSVQNLAFLRSAELAWAPGLNLLTGETGSGKSLLIESLSALLAYKAELPPVSEKAVIEAEFAPLPPAALTLLEEPADPLLLRCEIFPNGRKRYFLNDSPTTAQTLRRLAYYLVEIHSQHDTQQLFQAPFQRELLDSYAELTEELQSYQALYGEWKRLTETLAEVERSQAERTQRMDWLSTQLEELGAARLSAEEYAQLEARIRRLEHQEQAVQTLSQWLHQLSEATHAPPTLLKEAEKALSRLPLAELAGPVQLLEQARSLIQEATALIESLLNDFSLDPAEIETLRQRYDTYNTLLLKYRLPTVESLIDLYERYRSEYENLQQQTAQLGPLREELASTTQRLLDKAYTLELARLAAAHTLADCVQGYLSELGLGQAHFHIAVERLSDPQSPYQWDGVGVQITPQGFSSVTFLLRTHPDLPLAPLSQIASGGELSRIMLALKAALAEKVQMPTLVLDEIDTGLSGEGARRMGSFLSKMAQRLQLIIITHLPAIAAQPGKHFIITRMATAESSWQTTVRALSPAERIEAIAHMLGGEVLTEATLAAARSLLETAAQT